jgi:hypothetical protein
MPDRSTVETESALNGEKQAPLAAITTNKTETAKRLIALMFGIVFMS